MGEFCQVIWINYNQNDNNNKTLLGKTFKDYNVSEDMQLLLIVP